VTGVVAAVLLGIPAAGWIYQKLGARRDARLHPPPGTLVEAAGARLHVRVIGAGPSVILESGISASSVSWGLVQEPLSAVARVAAYDRAGYGWSPPSPFPRTMGRLVEEMRAMLEAAGLHGPHILVGHSFGGLLVRHFAAKYPDQVRGLVLADPLEPSEWHPATKNQGWRLRKGVALSRRGAFLARTGLVRAALGLLLSGSRLLPRMVSRVSSGKGVTVTDRIVGELRKLPQEAWPVLASHWCRPSSFQTMAEYLERLPANCAEPFDSAPLRSIPTTVISAGRSSPEVIDAHRRTAAQSTRGRHLIAGDSGHWVQLDRPDLIIDGVKAMLAGLD
jgi:pimeloyl-ACP methyl ester carboxylesterase